MEGMAERMESTPAIEGRRLLPAGMDSTPSQTSREEWGRGWNASLPVMNRRKVGRAVLSAP